MHRTGFLLVICTIIIIDIAHAQVANNIEQVFRDYNQWYEIWDVDYAYNEYYDIEVAFLAAGPSGLQCLDVTNPADASLMGYWDFNLGSSRALDVQGNFAYLVDRGYHQNNTIELSHLYVIDVSNPHDPEMVGECELPEGGWDIAVDGDYAYIAGEKAGVVIVDISQANDPEIASSTEILHRERTQTIESIDYNQGFVYAGASTRFWILDVSNPREPDQTSNMSVRGSICGICASGDEIYIAIFTRGLLIIDVSNENSPRQLGEYVLNDFEFDYCWGVDVIEDMAYLARWGNGLTLIDVGDPREPEEVGHVDVEPLVGRVKALEETAYLACQNNTLLDPYKSGAFRIISTANPGNPEEIYEEQRQGMFQDIAIKDTFAFATNGYLGLYVFDLSDPVNPEEITILDTDGSAEDITIYENYAYIADGKSGMVVIDISVPAEPEIVSVICRDDDNPPYTEVQSIAVSGETAFLADGAGGIVIVDISEPENPEIIRTINSPSRVVSLFENYLLSFADGLLTIIDVANRRNPDVVNSIEYSGAYVSLTIEEGLAYLTTATGPNDNDHNLRIIDIRDPENAEEIVCYEGLQQYCFDCCVSDGFAYMAAIDHGIIVLDVRHPDNIHQVGFFETPGFASGIALYDDLIYVADNTNLGVYSFTPPEPEPNIRIEPDSLYFGQVSVGRSTQMNVFITNIGEMNLRLWEVIPEGNYFECGLDEEVILEFDSTYVLTVVFAPGEEGEFEGDLTIISNDPDSGELNVDLFGIGTNEAPYVVNRIEDIVVAEDPGLQIVADLDTVFADPNNNELVYRIIGQDELNLVITEENILTFEPDADFWIDESEVIVVADDQQNNMAQRQSRGIFTPSGVRMARQVSLKASYRAGELPQNDQFTPRRDLTGHTEFTITVIPVNDPPSSFSLLEPADSSIVWDYPNVNFTWEDALDVEADTISYALVLGYNEEEQWFRGIQENSVEICREEISSDPDRETLIDWSVWAYDGTDSSRCSAPFRLTITPLSADRFGSRFPTEFAINSIHPNPFNSSTTISYSLPVSSQVSLKVFDLSGREVMSLVEGYESAGKHLVSISGEELNSGIYFLKLDSKLECYTKSMIFLK